MERKTIKQWIAEGNTETAVQQLLEAAKGTTSENEVMLLAARFQKYQRDVRLGTAGEEEYRQELNRINFALLQLSDALAENEDAQPSHPSTQPALAWYWWLILLLAAAGLAWYFIQKKAEKAPVYQFQYKQKDIPADVLNKIDSLQKAGQLLRDISFGPGGQWAIFYGRNRFITSGNLPRELMSKIDTFGRIRDEELKGLYLGANSEALLWFNRNFFWHTAYREIPKNCLDSLGLCHRLDREIRDVAIDPVSNSWVILWDLNGYTYSNIHDTLLVHLKRSSIENNGLLKSIEFSNDGGWILLSDYNNYWYGFVDNDLITALMEVQKNQRELLGVYMLTGNKWILLYR